MNQSKMPSPTIGAQRRLLALFMEKPDLMYREIRPYHFDSEELRAIFEEMLRLHAEGVELTPSEIYNSENPRIQKILQHITHGKDGAEWLKVAFKVSPSKGFEHYSAQILDDYTNRALVEKFEAAVARNRAAVNEDPVKRAELMLAEVEAASSEVLNGSTSSVCLGEEPWEELLADGQRRCTEFEERGRLSLGSSEFDRLIHGMPYGRFGIVVADKKAGKSTLLLNLAMLTAVGVYLNASNEWESFNEHTEPALVLDNEMDYEMDFKPRALAWLSGIAVDVIRSGAWIKAPDLVERMKKAHAKLARSPIYFEKVPPGDITAVKATVRKHLVKYGVRRVFYDYIKRPTNVENMYVEMGNFASLMQKEVVKDMKVSVIAAAQARDDGRVAGSIDLIRECDISFKLSVLGPDTRTLRIDASRFTPTMGENEYFEVICDLANARMHIGKRV